MMNTYREMKKGKLYLLFLDEPRRGSEESILIFTLTQGEDPEADIKRYSRHLYGMKEPHLGKFNLDGGDPDDVTADSVDPEKAQRLQEEPFGGPQTERYEATKVENAQKARWKEVILRRYAAYMPPKR